MAPKTVFGNQKLAQAIKTRRIELHLTIEAAAEKAGVGTKTWCRYEAGESIRQDKCKGVCRALNWLKFPADTNEQDDLNISEYRKQKTWSKYLQKEFGDIAALSFVIGSDILLDHIDEDLEALSRLPSKTHIGQLGASFIEHLLPKQFLMNYDYDFLYAMRSELLFLRNMAHTGNPIVAHSVLAELILHMIVDEAEILIESDANLVQEPWKNWIYDIFDDMDIDTWLYSNSYISCDHCYHFSHWLEQQFYLNR